jgi:hypothetical protein
MLLKSLKVLIGSQDQACQLVHTCICPYAHMWGLLLGSGLISCLSVHITCTLAVQCRLSNVSLTLVF